MAVSTTEAWKEERGEAGQGDGAGRLGRDDAVTEVGQGGGAGERGGGSRAGRRGGGVEAGDAVVEFVARLSGWFTSQETRGPIGGLRSDTDGIFTARSHIWRSSATSRPVVFGGYPRLCQSPVTARPWVTTGPEGLVVERRAHRQVGGSGKKAKNSYHLNPSFMGPGLCGPTDRRCPPDPQMALARLPSLARGRESCRASHPPKHGRPVRIHASWRTESPRRRFRRDDQVSPVPPPRPTRRPPRPPGWLATAGMQHTNKTPMPHSPGRHQGDDGDLKKTGFKPQRSKTLNDNR